MVTYLIGTDGEPASRAISEHLEMEVTPEDRVEAVYVTTKDSPEATRAVELIDERLGSKTNVDARVVDPGRDSGPLEELLELAEEVSADIMVVGLRRHSRTERIIMGSISHALIERVTIPLLLVPLPEYQPPEG